MDTDCPVRSVLAASRPILRGKVDRRGILRVGEGVAAVAPRPGVEPDIAPAVGITGVPFGGRPEDGGVVLGPAVDPVGILVVHGDVVELPDGDVVVMEPCPAPVECRIDAAVVPDRQMGGIAGVDPHLAVVEMEGLGRIGEKMKDVPAEEAEIPAAIAAVGDPDAQGVDLLVVLRIQVDIGEIPADLGKDQQVFGVGPRPGQAAVGRLVDFGTPRLALVQVVDEDIGFGRVGRGNGQPDAARLRTAWQPSAETAPGLPGVLAFPYAARRAGYAGVVFPRRGVDDRGIRGGDDHVVGTGAFVDVQDVFPGGPAIERPVESAVGIGRPVVAMDGDEGDVGVGRMDVDLADVEGILKAEMAPILPTVVRTVDARSGHGEVARLFEVDARPQPDRLRTRRGQGDVTDPGSSLVFEDRLPGQAVVRRLPEAAGAEGGV